MDSRTRPWSRHSVEGQLQQLARPEAGSAEAGRIDGIGASESAEERTGMGAPESEGTPGEVEGSDRTVRGTQQPGIPEAQRNSGNLHPCRRAQIGRASCRER